MGLERDDFNNLLKEKRHVELIKKLDAILQGLLQEDTSLDISGIETAIQSITVKEDIQEIPKAILALSDTILSKITELQKSPTEWIFDIERDSNGYIDIVKATATNE